MSDPNPYEPPQIESRPATGRRLAVGATLVLLSIPAASIAGFGTCTASGMVLANSGYGWFFVVPLAFGLIVAVGCYLLAAWWLEGKPRIEADVLNSRRFWHCVGALASATPVAFMVGYVASALGVVYLSTKAGGTEFPDWPFFAVVGSGTYAACLIALHLARKRKPNGENKP